MYELSTEAEKPSEAHECDQAQVYFKNGLLILTGRFDLGCLLSGTVDGPYGMGKRANIVKKNWGYGNSQNNNLAIASVKPTNIVISISNKHHLEMIEAKGRQLQETSVIPKQSRCTS